MRLVCFGLLALFGCDTPTDSAAPAFDATGTLAEAAPSVLVVDYSLPEAGSAIEVRVDWGPTDAYGNSTVIGTTASGRGAVVGLHPQADTHWRVVAEVDGEALIGPDHVVSTGPVPALLQPLAVEAPGSPTFGHVLTSTLGEGASAVIYDDAGMPVWWMSATDGAYFPEVRRLPDGRGVALQQLDFLRESDIGAILAYAWDGTLLSNTRTPLGHHDFVVHEDGSYTYCAMDLRDAEVNGELTPVVGEALHHIPAGGSTDDITVLWTSWDTLPVRVDPASDSGYYPQGLDWVHCNGLAYEPESDRFLMSAYELGSVLAIHATTGELEWVFGGLDGEFSSEEPIVFRAAHSPDPLDDGFRLFINRTAEPRFSRVARFRVDEAGLVAEELSSIDLGEQYYTQILGDTNTLPTGDVLISWGFAGVMSEVDEAGTLVWNGSAELGTVFGFAEVIPPPGGPI